MVGQWIAKKVTELLGVDDDIVSNYVISQLELAGESGPNPKEMQLYLTGNSIALKWLGIYKEARLLE